eukprot:5651134-Amphidinium_carterae.1
MDSTVDDIAVVALAVAKQQMNARSSLTTAGQEPASPHSDNSIMRSFLQQCLYLAGGKGQVAIEGPFVCGLALRYAWQDGPHTATSSSSQNPPGLHK